MPAFMSRDESPRGYIFNRGQVLRSLNLSKGKGNFYLKPNGVFFTWNENGKVKAVINRSEELAQVLLHKKSKHSTSSIRLATQSGPLLLRRRQNSSSIPKGIQNPSYIAMGWESARKVFVFAITGKDGWVNLHGFARLFLHLGCRDALFLDVDISQMAVHPKKLIESNRFGAMFVVTEPAE